MTIRSTRTSGRFTHRFPKLSRRVRPYFLLQLCFYSELLTSAQGVAPNHSQEPSRPLQAGAPPRSLTFTPASESGSRFVKERGSRVPRVAGEMLAA